MRILALLPVIIMTGCFEFSFSPSIDDASFEIETDAAFPRPPGQQDEPFVPLLEVCTVPRPEQGPEPAECKALPTSECTPSACPEGICLQLVNGARCTTACRVDENCAAQERCQIIERLGEGYCVPRLEVAP